MLNPARRNARERALELLYEAEIKSLTVAEVLRGLPLQPDPFAVELVNGVARNRELLDADIIAHLRSGWSLHRLATIDRLVLRIGIEELRHNLDVPTAVVLDESVRLAKGFSSDESAKFVNGVLAAIARAVRPDASDVLPDFIELASGSDPLDDTIDQTIDHGVVATAAEKPKGVSLEEEPVTGLDV